MIKKSTVSVRAQDAEKNRKWYVMDAAGVPLGRLAVDAAMVLRGKHKPTFTPHVDTGDHVIIVNADKVVMTGANKGLEEIRHHTGWPGGLKAVRRGKELENEPEKAVYRVVRGMIPHNKLGDQIITKLKVYRGAEHPHAAQVPVAFTGGAQKRYRGE